MLHSVRKFRDSVPLKLLRNRGASEFGSCKGGNMDRTISQESIVGIHLDLKYLMPSKAYLNQWVRSLPHYGINTLLLEYEDKFPFQKYPFLRAEDAFTPRELQSFLAMARGAGLRVIPLVQTLSHLEFALAHPALAPLREGPGIPTQICPSNPDAVLFVRELLDEVLAFHAEDRWFHIGADEAWSLGACPACAARVAAQDALSLWMAHTRAMCGYVQARGKRPLVWDDGFWKCLERERELPPEAVLCSWHYGNTQRNPASALDRCASHYGRVGRAFLGIPCANWGVLLPRHRHTLDNIATVASAARDNGALGVINSAWAVFHLPLPVYALQIAATAESMRGGVLSPDWAEETLAREYGTRVPGLTGALEALGRLWEVPVGLERPITPMTHGYMDMILHYPEGQKDRVRQGAYPLDWNTIDFTALYRRKLDRLRALPSDSTLRTDLARLLDEAAAAVPVLSDLSASATRHPLEAALLASLGRYRWLALRALARHLDPARQDGTLPQELAACRTDLTRLLNHFYEASGTRRFLRLHMEPVETSLALAGDGASVSPGAPT